ncbi:hypothetical protein J437_LFUL014360 [Ladona fulva]|uniref:Uncharacterized protein n=1 Tax=Ladona fulva TaxID=123851 RepID=A0A8K0P5Z1_LADFU|nr:hypothetical protein J437_LFUL014360 [Ladona fulva]
MQHKPGESIQELAARIRQDAAKCDFSSIQDPHDEAIQDLYARAATSLEKRCRQLCKELPHFFKSELGCLKDFQLEIKFKPDANPILCKPRTVPPALLEDLNLAYDAGIRKWIWQPVQFNEWGTPVVQVRKALLPDGRKANLSVCGDYSVTVNPQLETHQHLIPLPEDLMRKLGGGYFFSKIDLADAYN